MAKRDARQVEFGDFQTPAALAARVVAVLAGRGVAPAAVIEPTCGVGAFVAAARGFASVRRIVGVDIDAGYLAEAGSRLRAEGDSAAVELTQGDFFEIDWRARIRSCAEPVLILGNPPWVTSAGLGAIGGTNLPEKSNFQGRAGLDAITGKSNFDIAEWMVLRLIEAAAGRLATVAMLVKTSTARRVLAHAWRVGMPIARAAMYETDAAAHFDVAASACLLVCDVGGAARGDAGCRKCEVFHLDAPAERIGAIAIREGMLVADARVYDRLGHRMAGAGTPRWRSGVKHDCSAVMELRRAASGALVNGLGEEVRIEEEFVFPMMKGSEVAGGRAHGGVDGGVRGGAGRWMIVPQRTTGDDTERLREVAPRTWAYLAEHGAMLDGRRSSIYRKRARFAVFGIGAYTFAPWKVAICGLYKRLAFAVVGPAHGKPVVFDDTVYHLSFETESEARGAAETLNSEDGRALLNAMIFWDAKRPITAEVLGKLDLGLAAMDGAEQVSGSDRGMNACS